MNKSKITTFLLTGVIALTLWAASGSKVYAESNLPTAKIHLTQAKAMLSLAQNLFENKPIAEAHLNSTESFLELAKEQLLDAEDNKGGHRRQAINDTQTAIRAINKAKTATAKNRYENKIDKAITFVDKAMSEIDEGIAHVAVNNN